MISPNITPVYFTLDATFRESLKAAVIPWGFGGLSEFTFYRTYSRVNLETGHLETWPDCVTRVIEGMYSILKTHAVISHVPWDDAKAQRHAQEAAWRLFTFRWTPPGRGLWMMGTKFVWERGAACLQNCAFVSTDDLKNDLSKPFRFLMDMSMLGVGVGFDTAGAGQVNLVVPEGDVDIYKVPDTREGWVELIGRQIDSFMIPGSRPVGYNTDGVRPYGEPIKGFGGVASGPVPLEHGFHGIGAILRERALRSDPRITSTDIVDIQNLIGKTVVAGNVRRSAEIAFAKPDDEEFMEMKAWDKFGVETGTVAPPEMEAESPEDYALFNSDWDARGEIAKKYEKRVWAYKIGGWRWASNNSILAEVGMDYTRSGRSTGLNGEPGFAWLQNMRRFGRMQDPANNRDHRAKGGNPCLEQTLESYECCVSGSTRITHEDGCTPISERVGRLTRVWNGDAWSTVTPRITGEGRELYRVTLSDGSYLDCTENHGWHVRPPGKRLFRKVETRDLVAGSRSVSFELGSTAGVFEPYAFEWGLFAGDGYLDQGRYAMLCVHGDKTKLADLDVHGTWYKAQEREGFKPTNRLNFHGYLDYQKAGPLNDKTVGLPDWVFEWDRVSILAFVAGWVETDGTVTRQENTDGYRVYGGEAKMRDLQLLLRRVGINYASVNKFADAGEETNYGVRNYALWYVQIPSFESAEIPTRLKVAEKIGSRFKKNNAYADSAPVDAARKQHIVSVEKLPGLHTVYCFDEPENHMGVFGNVLTYQCNLVETFPVVHRDYWDYQRTLKFAYLYSKAVTLVGTHWQETNAVMLRNRRIGCSQSGILEGFVKFGRRRMLSEFCDQAYHYIGKLDRKYSEWLTVRESIKMTSVKPSGTVSLLAGRLPGIHGAESISYYRLVRVASNSKLLPVMRAAGYRIEPATTDPIRTAIIYFPVAHDPGVPTKAQMTIWEQVKNAADYQRWWADNQVSITVSFKATEIGEIAKVLAAYETELKGISFLPLSDHGYVQAPYTPAPPQEIADYAASLKPLDFSHMTEAGENAAANNFCDGEKCSIP